MPPVRLRAKTGNAAGVSRSILSVVSAGSVSRISAIRLCTCCSARIMSVDGSNCAEISVAPRNVRDRTRRMPGTSMMACSIGRAMVRTIDGPGCVPACAMTAMRGNCSGG